MAVRDAKTISALSVTWGEKSRSTLLKMEDVQKSVVMVCMLISMLEHVGKA